MEAREPSLECGPHSDIDSYHDFVQVSSPPWLSDSLYVDEGLSGSGTLRSFASLPLLQRQSLG